MTFDKEKALKQLEELEKLGKDKRLAADEWDEDWKILIAVLLSARTMDKTTIPIAEKLFEKYDSVEKLAKASEKEVAEGISGVNFYLNKARYVKALVEKLLKDYDGKVPHDFDKLVELPGVGRKTANVFLAAKGEMTIGIDTHVDYISHYLGWTKGKKQEEVEKDLKGIFPERLWGKLNWTLVRFGQTYTNRTEKNKILDRIKEL
ncbi:endonuclease III [Candidatus Pacearchaeota archaeon]|nr:endonuclease III [Candidatus Pacearchaeota archaeon]|tara:strand:- start:10126 stop:10740 length:615 start_codon:yes stop_codon:yes gene_type:complete